MPHDLTGAPAPDSPRTHEQVLTHTLAVRDGHEQALAALKNRQRRALSALAFVVVAIVYETAHAMRHGMSAWPMLLSFAAVVVLIGMQLRLQNRVARAQRLLVFHDSAVHRIDGSERYGERTGLEAAEAFAPGHLYLRDLDIVGERSLFSLLGTVRTGAGERGLAHLLLAPATHEEAVARQEAVRELMPRTALREQIALLGSSRFQQLSANYLDIWLDEAPPRFHPLFRVGLGVTAAVNLGLLVVGLLGVRPWPELWTNLLAVLGVQAALALAMRARALPLLETKARLEGEIRLFGEGLALLQGAEFTSARLEELQRLSREPAGAVAALKKLAGSLSILEQRKKEYFYVFSLLLAAGSQAAISISQWKREHAEAMRLWLAVWAEFEALNALATWAYEHPEDAWPELLPASASPRFEAVALGHPLLPEGVRNDLVLGEEPRFLLISGSNMAGKSTLMRSIGAAAVLAYAGAPVRAASLRLTPLRVGASIALTDSLTENKSKFLAEVERLAAIVAVAQSAPVLFLVDEIFSGTNSADRFAAAAAVLTRLLAGGAVGALSTHDLALTSLADDAHASRRGVNVHMSSPDDEDPLAFDYRLKPGINRSSSAQALIRMLGLPG